MMNTGLIASSHRRLVLGLGDTGRSVLRFYGASGTPYIAADTRAALLDDGALMSQLQDTEHYIGELPTDLVDGVEEIVASPGIALDHPVLVRARAAGVRVRGDIDLFMEQVDAPVIGITGSNGKSTVTALTGHLLKSAGRRAAIGGNIGRPALDLLGDKPDIYVLELSSFQLERSENLNLAAATVLNLSPDHLDRHGTMIAYQQAKHRIFRGARRVIACRDDPLTTPLLEVGTESIGWRLGEPDLLEFGLREIDGETCFCRGFDAIAPVSSLPLAGKHNVGNALAALALTAAVGVPLEELGRGLESFAGLPHRCALVTSHGDVHYIDDSKATNVGATIAALDGLAGAEPLVLIAGGQGKGQDMSLLRPCVARHCRAVVLLGEAADTLEAALAGVTRVVRASSMDDAVQTATTELGPKGTVLLSPACASFDMFSGFAARGDAFARAALASGAAS